ncbi:MAG TPA: hypothetical protein VKM55_23995 [Candidatus Lokiarchaeia archaeon]|nr:hypothetical protein [Candidatus Lokiarchaeia archaeon]
MDPAKAAKLRQKAEELFDKEEFDKALEYIVKSLEEHPDNPIAWQLQGLIQEACNYKAEAIKSFQETIKRDSNCEVAYIGIVRIYRLRKDYFKAFEILADLASKNPSSKLLRQIVLDVLENDNKAEWEELFKVQPEILIEIVKNAKDDIDLKYKMTGVLKNVAVSKPELFQGKALEIISELANSDDDEIRSTAYILLVAAYEASPIIIEKYKQLLVNGVIDKNNYIQKSTAGIIKSMLDYFPDFLADEDEMLLQALEQPVVAEVLLKTLPSCPQCKSQDDMYLQRVIQGEKLLRFYCEKCDIKFYRQPGNKTVTVMDKAEARMKGPVVCPECKMQYLVFNEQEKLYSCSVCKKWFTQ